MRAGFQNIVKYYNEIFKSTFLDSELVKEDNERKRKQFLLHFFLFMTSFFSFTLGSFSLYNGFLVHGFTDIGISIVTALLSIVLYKKNNPDQISFPLVVVLSVFFLYLMFNPLEDHSGHVWSFLIPIASIYLLGNRKGMMILLLFIIISFGFFSLDFPPEKFDFSFKVRFIGAYLSLTIVVLLLEKLRHATSRQLRLKNFELQNHLADLELKDSILAESNAKYKLLFEESADAVVLLSNGKIIDCNLRTTELFGYSKEELIGQSAEMLSPKYQPDKIASKDKIQPIFEEAFREGKIRFVWLHKKKDGTLFYGESSFNLLNQGNSTILFTSIRDMTNQKRIEEALIKAKEDAEKSDRLKSEFLAQMSHEIRTPVNAIVNFSSLVKMDMGDNLSEDNNIAFNAIESSATRLMRTINLILNMSEIESGTYEPHFEFVKLVKDIINPLVVEFSAIANTKNLSLELHDKLPADFMIFIDSYTVSQTLLNLIDNALKYTNSGGVAIECYRSGNSVVIDVIDSGIGISEKYLPMLFKKFTQEQQGYTRQFEGNGLGLAIVREYCKINNADIQVESSKGHGSKFTLIFDLNNHKTNYSVTAQ